MKGVCVHVRVQCVCLPCETCMIWFLCASVRRRGNNNKTCQTTLHEVSSPYNVTATDTPITNSNPPWTLHSGLTFPTFFFISTSSEVECWHSFSICSIRLARDLDKEKVYNAPCSSELHDELKFFSHFFRLSYKHIDWYVGRRKSICRFFIKPHWCR